MGLGRIYAITALGALLVATNAAGAQAKPSKPVAAEIVVDSTPKSVPHGSRVNWLSDGRDFSVGDIITVFIDDETSSNLDKQTQATQNRNRSGNFSLSTGTPPGTNFGLNTGMNNTSTENGHDGRTNAFRTEMSVRVVGISPTGILKLSGQKMLSVDKGKQAVTLTGYARPQDIAADNTVSSIRMADATLEYDGQKSSLSSPKSGIIGKILGIFWP